MAVGGGRCGLMMKSCLLFRRNRFIPKRLITSFFCFVMEGAVWQSMEYLLGFTGAAFYLPWQLHCWAKQDTGRGSLMPCSWEQKGRCSAGPQLLVTPDSRLFEWLVALSQLICAPITSLPRSCLCLFIIPGHCNSLPEPFCDGHWLQRLARRWGVAFYSWALDQLQLLTSEGRKGFQVIQNSEQEYWCIILESQLAERSSQKWKCSFPFCLKQTEVLEVWNVFAEFVLTPEVSFPDL